LQWAWNEDKTRALLLDIFSHRKRFSQVQGRLWRRVITLYWKSGWTARQIGDQFGVSLQNIRRLIQSLRREAQRYFGQALQPPEGQVLQSEKPKPAPIVADPTNESQEYWEQVLASHGLYNPDKRAKGWTRKNPVYKFEWQSTTSVHAEGWGAFYDNETRPKPACHTLQKTGGSRSWGKSKQIGTRTTEIDGKSHDVRVFEVGRSCTFAWNTNPRRSAGRSVHDPEHVGVAHTVTLKHVDAAIDGDREAREYLRQYEELEAKKYTNPRGFPIIPGMDDPCEGRPIIQDFHGTQSSRDIDVRIDADGTVHKIAGKATTAPRLIERGQCRDSDPVVGPVKSADAKQNQAYPDSYFLGKGNPQKLEEPMQEPMQFQQAAEIIKQHDIPRSTVARLSGMYLSDLSGWLNGRTDLSQDKIERISIVVADISKLVEGMATVEIKIDLTDCDNVRRLVQRMNDIGSQMDLSLPGEDLRMEADRPGETATA